MLVDYGSLMTGNEWAPEDEVRVDRKDLKLRAPPWMKSQLIALALVETRVRKIRSGGGVLSVNKMLAFIVERFLAAYQVTNGVLPDAADKKTIDAYAAQVVVIREREERDPEKALELKLRARIEELTEELKNAYATIKRLESELKAPPGQKQPRR